MMQLLRSEVHHPEYVAVFEGFALALKAFAQAGKLRSIDDLDEGFYGFYMAPAMNSVRRTGAPLADCFEVFTGVHADDKLTAMSNVIANNELRKQLVIDLFTELTESYQPLAPWVWFSDAPVGMLGLLANKLMQSSGMPTVVLNHPGQPGEPISGSGRAPGWFDIIATLDQYPGLRAIGHAQACGVKVDDTTSLNRLAEILATDSASAMLNAGESATQDSVDLTLGPDPDCDASLANLDAVAEMTRRIEELKPFGHEFPAPVFRLAIEPDRCNLRRIGSAEQHLRITTGSGLACLMWNISDEDWARIDAAVSGAQTAHRSAIEQGQPIPQPPTLRLDAKLQLNVWNGLTRLQAIVIGLAD